MGMKRRSSMVPFLTIEPGEWVLFQFSTRLVVPIRTKERDCLQVNVLARGNGSIPDEATLRGHYKVTPVPVLIGANKGLVDALYPDGDETKKEDLPDGRYFVALYGGEKEIPGGKFKQWEVVELTEDGDEDDRPSPSTKPTKKGKANAEDR